MYALMGVAAKLATLNKDRKITKAQALATIASGILCGYIAALLCENYQVSIKLQWVFVSVSALSGENITGWILGNARTFLDQILKILTKSNGKKN